MHRQLLFTRLAILILLTASVVTWTVLPWSSGQAFASSGSGSGGGGGGDGGSGSSGGGGSGSSGSGGSGSSGSGGSGSSGSGGSGSSSGGGSGSSSGVGGNGGGGYSGSGSRGGYGGFGGWGAAGAPLGGEYGGWAHNGGFPDGRSAHGYSADQDWAREAVIRGWALPLSQILPVARRAARGQVLDVVLLRAMNGAWIYHITVLSPDGRYRDIYMDASRNRVIEIRQR